jgi:branched-chain amino acid transport system permease protein
MQLALVIHLLVIVTIYGILALGLNLVTGSTGLFNLGHAAFYGIGAYTSALLTKAGVPWLPAMLAGVVLAGVVAFVVGIPTLRLVGDYLAVVTMGLGEIARAVFKNWISLTRGPMGLPGIPRAGLLGVTFDTPEKFLILSSACLLVAFILVQRLLHSPFGRVLRSIREDEVAAQSLGKDVYHYKMWSLIIGSALAGMAGSLFAHYIAFIDPGSFVMWLTFFIFLIIVLGGMGNNVGALVVTVVFVTLREGLRFVNLPEGINPGALQQAVFGVLLILATIFVPRGLIPERRVTYERE